MQVIEIQNQNLEIASRQKPKLESGQILIEVHAIGINRADIFQRQGSYPPPEGVTDIPGLEVSGIVIEVSNGVSEFKEGDKVCALLEGGGYAQYVAANESQVFKLPQNLDFLQGAALPEALFTVWLNLVEQGEIDKFKGDHHGKSILIHGASSGIGTMAIQVAKTYNMICYASTSADSKKVLSA